MSECKAAFGSQELLVDEGHEGLLIRRALEGDELACTEIVKTHETMVFNLALRCVGNLDEACDVCQDVFLQAFSNLGKFRGHSTLKTWLYRITLNMVANRNRWWSRKKRLRPVSLDSGKGEDGAALLSVIPSRAATPEDEAAAAELRDRVASALRHLPMGQRAVVVLRDLEGLAYDEIARVLGISEGTVKSRLARGREKVRVRLTGDRGEEKGPHGEPLSHPGGSR